MFFRKEEKKYHSGSESGHWLQFKSGVIKRDLQDKLVTDKFRSFLGACPSKGRWKIQGECSGSGSGECQAHLFRLDSGYSRGGRLLNFFGWKQPVFSALGRSTIHWDYINWKKVGLKVLWKPQLQAHYMSCTRDSHWRIL